MIKEITKKYTGNFTNERIKKKHISDKTYLIEQGVIEVNKSNIIIELYENDKTQLFYRLSLRLNELDSCDFNLYPIDLWNHLLDKIRPKRREYISKKIRSQFWFRGNKKMINKISFNSRFIELLNKERVFIETNKAKNTFIVLTPENGKMDKNQCEKYIEILKIIESEIKNVAQQYL